MEEKIKDIFSNIKDRLSNPLIFSFLISWLLYNWEITVALFWYDKSQITADGHKSIFEFIQNKLDTKYYSTVFPLGFALMYTFGMPYLKEFVDLTNKKAILFGKKWKTRFLKDNLFIKINDLEQKLELINNSSLLDGYWKVTIYNKENNSIGVNIDVIEEIDVYISNRDYYIIENDSRKKKYFIRDFYFNPSNNSIIFIKELYNFEQKKNLTYNDKCVTSLLSLTNGYWSNLSGTENDIKIEYRKI